MCSSDEMLTILIIVNRILNIIRIIAPILLIIALSVNIFNIVRDPDNDKLKKKLKNKIIAILVLFFIPTIARATINMIATNNDCLEEEQLLQLKEGYSPFKNVQYIEIESKNKQSILEDADSYEKGEEKHGISAPKFGVVSEGNAIYFLNTGYSSDSFIIKDGEHFGLIDTSYSGYGGFIVKQLQKLGCRELDFILITHSHGDHVGGYSKVINSIPVKTLIIKTEGASTPSHQSTYSSIIKKAKSKGANICNGNDPQCQSFSLGNINFQLYNTGFLSGNLVSGNNRNRFDNANSLVAIATINGKRIYFAGDIGNYFGHNQESITAKQIGDIDVYKVAHHGYVSFNNNQDALNYLKPEYAVVTNGRNTAFTAISRVKKSNSNFKKTYYTPNGTVTLIVDPDGKLNFYQ